MPYKGLYVPGDRPVICDVSGVAYHFSEMRKGVSGSQKGFNVGPDNFDEPHPLDKKVRLRPKRPLEKVK